jgi:hypothetical protein
VWRLGVKPNPAPSLTFAYPFLRPLLLLMPRAVVRSFRRFCGCSVAHGDAVRGRSTRLTVSETPIVMQLRRDIVNCRDDVTLLDLHYVSLIELYVLYNLHYFRRSREPRSTRPYLDVDMPVLVSGYVQAGREESRKSLSFSISFHFHSTSIYSIHRISHLPSSLVSFLILQYTTSFYITFFCVAIAS